MKKSSLKKINYSFEEQDELECCGVREFVFVNELCEFILLQKNSVWVAHNGGRFDTIFILKFLLEQKQIYPETIMHGNKVMMLFIPTENIPFFDSYFLC